MNNYTVISEGGSGGNGFEMQSIKSIGLRSGKYVDQITINGVSHGENGGADRGTLTLEDGEYVTSIVVRSGSLIDYVEFNTNFNNQIKGGGEGGNKHTVSGNLVAIDGRSGKYVDQLNFLID
ncbi:MAG: hypothetical protein COA38_10255 [Fluviicola sp.]|nr:MAG: hypothetical protein COA38_10255 [Fluviicola sp.]